MKAAVAAAFLALACRALSCCAVTSGEHLVVNADQSVIILWDEARQTQHFIRQADFKTDAKDVGFIVPSPSRPRLEESGNEAFPRLKRITAPRVHGGGIPFGCAAAPSAPLQYRVEVIEQKRVAGFDATVLIASSGKDLAAWLKANGYPYSPAVAEWARPYLGGKWHFTALKVAKDNDGGRDIKASSLRITFQTDRPLFPYREPESTSAAGGLGAKSRLLRIYFIADSRYRGEIDGGRKWSGKAVWSGDITRHRDELLRDLRPPTTSGPARWWLTEFEDQWPYAKAAGDVYFQRDRSQREVSRESVSSTPPKDVAVLAMLAFACILPFRRAVSAGS